MALPIARELAKLGIRVIHDRARHLRHADAAGHERGNSRVARRAGAVSVAPGQTGGICAARAFIVENPMLNAEVIRLDGAIRMTAR